MQREPHIPSFLYTILHKFKKEKILTSVHGDLLRYASTPRCDHRCASPELKQQKHTYVYIFFSSKRPALAVS